MHRTHRNADSLDSTTGLRLGPSYFTTTCSLSKMKLVLFLLEWSPVDPIQVRYAWKGRKSWGKSPRFQTLHSSHLADHSLCDIHSGVYGGFAYGLPTCGLTPTQNRYLPMAYIIWSSMCMPSSWHRRYLRSTCFITVIFSWGYSHEVGA